MEHITVTVPDEVLELYNKYFPKIKDAIDKLPTTKNDDDVEILCWVLGYLAEECDDKDYNRDIFNETAAMLLVNILHLHVDKARELAASFKFEPNTLNS